MVSDVTGISDGVQTYSRWLLILNVISLSLYKYIVVLIMLQPSQFIGLMVILLSGEEHGT